MNKEIWLVTGNTGEYSDHKTWTVAAFTTEALAQSEADRMQALVIPFNERYAHALSRRDRDTPQANSEWYQLYREKEDFKVPGDPQFRMAYTGTEYCVEMVELRA